MTFNIENFMSPRALQTLRSTGLHKVAGVMAGIDELTIKEAVAMVGAKAHLRRCESQKIAEGINAYAALNGEKVADAMSAMIPRMVLPGIGGALIAAAPSLTADGPIDMDQLQQRMLLGGGLGALGGAGTALVKGLRQAPGGVDQGLAESIRNLP